MPTPDQYASPFRAAASLPLDRRYGGRINALDQLPIHALGDNYTVDGSGTVTSLPSLPIGETVLLKFTASPTLVNSTRLLMPNGINKKFAPGDKCTLRSEGDGIWRCVDISPANPGPLLVFEGDSLSDPAGAGVWTTYLPQISSFFGRGRSLNFATSGDTAASMVGEYATQGGAVSLGSGIEAYYFLWAGVNDLAAATTAATIYGYLTTMWAAARASGYKVVAFCVPACANLGVPTASAQLERLKLNNLILSNAALYDFVVRLDVLLPNCATPYISLDGTHFTTSINALIAQEVARTLLGLDAVTSPAFAAAASDNMFINPDFAVSQELGSSGAVLTTGTLKYVADGAVSAYSNTAGVGSGVRVDAASLGANAIPGLTGYHQNIFSTAISSLANGDYAIHRYYIEGYRMAKLAWGTAGAQPFSYAFMFYSSNAGTMFARIGNNSSRWLFKEFTVVSGWNFISDTIPGDITGTWSAINSVGMAFDVFVAGKGATQASVFDAWGSSNFTQTTNSTNLLSTNGSQTFVAGLYGSAGAQIATPLNLPLLMRPYEEALRLCKRQYEIIPPRAHLFSGNVTSGQAYYSGSLFQVEKLTTPTVTGVNASASNFPSSAGTINPDTLGVYESRVASGTGTGLFQSTITADARL